MKTLLENARTKAILLYRYYTGEGASEKGAADRAERLCEVVYWIGTKIGD